MKKLFVFLTVFVLLGTMVVPTFADNGAGGGNSGRPVLKAMRNLTPSACGRGVPIIDVHQRIVNDADKGSKGNVWALDSYEREIKVWRVFTTTTTTSSADAALETYCAIIKDAGRFVTVAGTSPGGTGDVAAGIRGTFEGGYRTVQFTGTLNESPIWRVRGNLGTFDYKCNQDGTCSEHPDWLGVYFSTPSSVDQAWYGWRYEAGKRGVFFKSSQGNQGDIK